MNARKALLKRLATNATASTADTGGADLSATFAGETCVETKNTIYRFRDGVCFAVVSRDRARNDRARALIGMRIVGWLSPRSRRGSTPARLTQQWEMDACAVLWGARPGDHDDGGTIALTSPSTDFTRALTSARLQAFHDSAPPRDSGMLARGAPPMRVTPIQPVTGTALHPPVLPPFPSRGT